MSLRFQALQILHENLQRPQQLLIVEAIMFNCAICVYTNNEANVIRQLPHIFQRGGNIFRQSADATATVPAMQSIHDDAKVELDSADEVARVDSIAPSICREKAFHDCGVVGRVVEVEERVAVPAFD